MSKKICFVSLGSYPLLNPSTKLKYVGGAELRQVQIGKELAKRGDQISFVTYQGDGNNDGNSINNVTLVQSYPHPGSRKVNILNKIKILYDCLKTVSADVYIHSSSTPGLVSLYCLIHRKKFIYWVPSNKSVQLESIFKKTSLLLKFALYLDIKFADLIIAQNHFQKETINAKFKRQCILIKNPIIISDEVSKTGKNLNIGNTILWVGTIRHIKQPELFLKLAEGLPQYQFKMIGGRSNKEPELYDEIKEKSKKLSNIEFLGFVPHHEIQKYYKEAMIFVNTSKFEGFPNTFLEAWLNCIPVVSLNVDPDEIISKYKLGFHSNTLNQLIEHVRSLSNDYELRTECGMNGRKYIEIEHDIKNIVDNLQKYF